MKDINTKYKNIFIHIPKNAGASMMKKYFVSGPGHNTLKEIINQNCKDYFIWCFVRNPYDKLVSLYHFWQKHNSKSLQKFEHDNFKKFVFSIGKYITNDIDEYLSDKKYYNVGLQPQHIFIDNTLTNNIFVGRFENINDDWNKVVNNIEKYSKIKLSDKSLKKINTSKHKNYKNYYDNETRDFVYELYKKDFENFNYKKEMKI